MSEFFTYGSVGGAPGNRCFYPETLIRRPESEQMKVPRDMVQGAIQLGKARGKLGSGKLISMLVKSKVDRFLASG